MRKLLLCLSLLSIFFQTAEAQTACANFITGNYTTITQENSFFGPGDVYHFECLDNVLLDGSCTSGATDYHLRIAEFDLNSWSFTKDYISDWVANSPPSATIDVSSYFPTTEPTCGKIYTVILAVGPVWDVTPPLFFTIDCPSIPFEETYACKENLHIDSTSVDVAYDQLFLNDGTRVITGYTKLGNQVSLFIEKMDANGVVFDKKQYPIQGDFVSNVQIVLDKPNNEFLLFFDTRVANNHSVYLLNVNSTSLAPIEYHSRIVPEINNSNEYAIKIEPDLNGGYMLLVNQSESINRYAYTVYTQRLGTEFGFSHNQISINIINSDNVFVYDIIETSGRIGTTATCASSFLLCGSVNNKAFLLGIDCFGRAYSTANTFDVDGNMFTTDPAKRLAYYNNKFYVAGETGTFSDFNTQISGKTWLGEFELTHILAPVEYFSAYNTWLNIYEKDNNRKESLLDLDFSDGYLYATGQTGIEDHFVITIGNTVGPKAYLTKFDLSGQIIWSKHYYEQNNTETKINDIELICGSIQGTGYCHDRLLDLTVLLPTLFITNQFVYKNKLNLNGLVAEAACYHNLKFSKIAVNLPVDEAFSISDGLSLIPEQLSSGYDNLLCEAACCSNVGVYCPSVIILDETSILPDTYHADIRVESAGSVENSTIVELKAGQNVRLNNGFSVEAGANFSARIEPCNCNLPAPVNLTIDDADANNIYLSWQPVTGVSQYYIEYVVDGGTPTYHYTTNPYIAIPFVAGTDHQYTVFTDCGETGNQGPTVRFTKSTECVDCDPVQDVEVTFNNDSLAISWDGAENASSVLINVYDENGDILETFEVNPDDDPFGIPQSLFDGEEVIEIGVSVICNSPDTFKNNVLYRENCHETNIIVIVSDDEPWRYGDYCGKPNDRPYKILCSHTGASATMAEFQCIHCENSSPKNINNVINCNVSCSCMN